MHENQVEILRDNSSRASPELKLLDLPNEVLSKICDHLDPFSMSTIMRTSFQLGMVYLEKFTKKTSQQLYCVSDCKTAVLPFLMLQTVDQCKILWSVGELCITQTSADDWKCEADTYHTLSRLGSNRACTARCGFSEHEIKQFEYILREKLKLDHSYTPELLTGLQTRSIGAMAAFTVLCCPRLEVLTLRSTVARTVSQALLMVPESVSQTRLSCLKSLILYNCTPGQELAGLLRLPSLRSLDLIGLNNFMDTDSEEYHSQLKCLRISGNILSFEVSDLTRRCNNLECLFLCDNNRPTSQAFTPHPTLHRLLITCYATHEFLKSLDGFDNLDTILIPFCPCILYHEVIIPESVRRVAIFIAPDSLYDRPPSECDWDPVDLRYWQKCQERLASYGVKVDLVTPSSGMSDLIPNWTGDESEVVTLESYLAKTVPAEYVPESWTPCTYDGCSKVLH